MDSLVKPLGDIFKKLPPLPANAVKVLFQLAPWVALIFGILGILTALAGFGVMTAFAPFAVAGAVPNYGMGFIAAIGLGISSVLMLLAFPGLKAGKMAGWNMLFLSEVVNVVASLVSISIGGIIGAVIAFYILYQIQPKYK